MVRTKQQPTLRDAVAEMFTSAPPPKKTFAEIVAKFSETRDELNELVADSDTAIAEIDAEIAELEADKATVAGEKDNALATLDFLNKFVKV